MKTDSLNSQNPMAHGHRFTYDPFGRRYSKETSEGQKEIYLYDGLHIIEVYDGNTMALKSSFVHSDVIDEVFFGTIQGQDLYYHQDGLNSREGVDRHLSATYIVKL